MDLSGNGYTFYVANRSQAAIFEMEMKGQMSDGYWENSSPQGHWKTPCTAKTVVRPDSVGRNFETRRQYNFGSRSLFDCVGDRMIRYGQAVLAFPDAALEVFTDVSSIIDENTVFAVARYHKMNDEYGRRRLDDLAKFFHALGLNANQSLETNAVEFEKRLAEVGYTERQCRKDTREMTKAFKQYAS